MNPVEVNDAWIGPIDELGVSVSWPNIDFDPVGEHIRISYIEASANEFTFGNDRIPSICQIDVVQRDGEGLSSLLGQVVDAFPKNREFNGVRIVGAPNAGPRIPDNGWSFVPVSIPYEVFR